MSYNQELIEGIRKLMMLNQSRQKIFDYLKTLGFSEKEYKKLYEEAMKGFEIRLDLQKLEQVAKKSKELTKETGKDKSPAELEKTKKMEKFRENIKAINKIMSNFQKDLASGKEVHKLNSKGGGKARKRSVAEK